MIVFDILSELESYVPVFPELATVISVLDRSLPYQEGPGLYETPEKSRVKYLIDEFITSEKGFSDKKARGKVLEVVLEGEEMISLQGSVFCLAEGRFIIYDDMNAKRGVSYLPSYAKAVRFLF